jgi:hypothetical protein
MNNEPVAWLSNDSFEISSMESNKFFIPLYTHSSEHDLGIAEAVGFDKGYKAATAKTLTDEEFDRIFADGKRLSVLEAEDKFRKEKTLTDEEILEIAQLMFVDTRYPNVALNFARVILKKASEK